MAIDFFRTKRYWSKYKDFILGYYLTPYIAKVKNLGRPILIVDCFAGPGRFKDGEPGSPLIILRAVREWRSKGVDVTAQAIEPDPVHFQSLASLMEGKEELVTPRVGTFEQHLPEIAARARNETVFLYVDPYSVRGLVFDAMKRVSDEIDKSGSSVELLLNFNSPVFVRWALAALKRHADIPEPGDDDLDQLGADSSDEAVEIRTLNSIAGGDYWRQIAANPASGFVDKVLQFTRAYEDRLLSSFPWVCAYAVKKKYEHTVPKYFLVYGTRHADGVLLMNDAMCNARRSWLEKQFREGLLFDTTPSEETLDEHQLRNDVLRVVHRAGPVSRRQLVVEVIREQFCRYVQRDIKTAITGVLKSGEIHSSTGKVRINDSVLLAAKPFARDA